MKIFLLLLAFLFSALPAYASGGGGSSKSDDAASVPRFVGFPVIIVNTADGLRYTGLLAVTVRLGVKGEAAYKRLEDLRPLLQDAVNQAVFRLGQLYVDPRKPLPWKRMVSEIDSAVKPIIPKEKYKVVITEVTTRPI
jgi:hypothetical protein